LYHCTHTLHGYIHQPRRRRAHLSPDRQPGEIPGGLGAHQAGEELPPIRTLALQLKVTPNTIVKAYHELEISGVVQKRQGSGTFISDARPQLALRQRRRVIEQRIDGLLAEAHQLNFTTDDILRMVRERKAAMDESGEEAAEEKKEAGR
jgi:GntR family transcriptional regulator